MARFHSERWIVLQLPEFPNLEPFLEAATDSLCLTVVSLLLTFSMSRIAFSKSAAAKKSVSEPSGLANFENFSITVSKSSPTSPTVVSRSCKHYKTISKSADILVNVSWSQ